MVRLDSIYKTYILGKARVEALKGLTAVVERGEFTCIMGPSGSGKTTLLNIIGCLDKPDNGTVLVDDVDVGTLTRNQLADLRAHKIGYIFQAFNLIPVLNVYENIEFPLIIQGNTGSRAERKQRIRALVDAVGLDKHIKHKPDELSGGQRQRVAIARALVGNPTLVLADEPTGNLDSKTAQEIIRLMYNLNEKEGVTFIFSTHDNSITRFASRVYRIQDGTIVDTS